MVMRATSSFSRSRFRSGAIASRCSCARVFFFFPFGSGGSTIVDGRNAKDEDVVGEDVVVVEGEEEGRSKGEER